MLNKNTFIICSIFFTCLNLFGSEAKNLPSKEALVEFNRFLWGTSRFGSLNNIEEWLEWDISLSNGVMNYFSCTPLDDNYLSDEESIIQFQNCLYLALRHARNGIASAYIDRYPFNEYLIPLIKDMGFNINDSDFLEKLYGFFIILNEKLLEYLASAEPEESNNK